MSRHAHIEYRSQPRTSLNPLKHGKVDAILKELKAHTKRIQTASETFSTEFRVLERIYYKGKNQHRSALFWKRVAETRRYCERLHGMKIEDIVANLRRSFFCQDGSEKTQTMKGSWTHVPEKHSIQSTSRRLQASLSLLTKMRERLAETYKCLSLHMQNGAFLQLTLTLVAVVSRLSAVISELHLNVCAIKNSLQSVDALYSNDEPDIQEALVAVQEDSDVPRPLEATEIIPPMENTISVPHKKAVSKATEPQRIIVECKVPPAVSSVPVKKKKKIRKDEIDDIFGSM